MTISATVFRAVALLRNSVIHIVCYIIYHFQEMIATWPPPTGFVIALSPLRRRTIL